MSKLSTSSAPVQSEKPRTSGFWPLAWLQSQGAFSDNVLKQILILYVASYITMKYDLANLLPGADSAANAAARISEQGKMNAIIGLIFTAPYLIFSCWAGFLADKFSKRTMTLITKVAELLVMFLAIFTLAQGDHDLRLNLSLLVLFLMMTHSAFFSPSKYGIIPELVPPERITWANGIIELMTFLSIIFGVSAATGLYGALVPEHNTAQLTALAAAHPGEVPLHAERLYIAGFVLVGLAVVGLLIGTRITRTPPANPTRRFEVNFLPELRRYFKILFANRTLALTITGLGYFWGLGAMLLGHVNVWGMNSLNLGVTQAGWLYFVLALGIGVGAWLAGEISKDRIELGLVPLGGLGLTLFAIPLGFATPGTVWIMIGCLFMLGISGGFFSVPLSAILQRHTDIKDRGGLIAAGNYVTFTSMLLFSAFLFVLNLVKTPPNVVFLIAAAISVGATLIILRLMPEALLRLVAFLLTRTFYRIKVFGREHLPAEGPALLVCNHVSFIDALLIMNVSPRPVRFIVWQGLMERRFLGWILRIMRVIPIGSEQRPRELLGSLRVAAEALRAGELVCIFAEGQITRTGLLLPLRKGYKYILKDAPAPILPVYLDGVWGSIFSFEGGKFFWKMPRRIPYPVRVTFGAAVGTETTAFDLRQRLEELGADSALAAKPDMQTLPRQLIRATRRHWGDTAMTDMLTPPITYGQVLWRSVMLARRLRPLWGDQKTVGVLLPPSVGAALVNCAAALSGRTVVNFNYTTGQAVLDSCAKQCQLKTVVTSRPFLEKVNLQAPGQAIWIEDHRGFKNFMEVFAAVLAARLMPAWLLERYCGAAGPISMDSLATIIFSSGSTGQPKGVMLTHFNIASNLESIRRGIRIDMDDRMLGILPFFHSFGFTISLWGSLTFPFMSVYHLSPLDIKTIGELCLKFKVTLIVSTPTFLQQYMRKLAPEQLGSLTAVVTGAERLPDKLRVAFYEKFGVEPLQGYGTTECAPVVATNTDDFRSPGFHQVGHKRGSIGHPLPGIAVRVLHPETGERLGADQPGLLHIRGGNIMQGYLGMPEKTAEVLRDGWYNTGDIARIDEDGFVFITDRASRFSKIGGEMVPHVTIEEKLHEALGLGEPSLVVTAVHDEAKGERLLVLHTLADGQLDGIAEKLQSGGLPNLWIPRRENFHHLDALPLLGTGKLDMVAIKRLAAEFDEQRQARAKSEPVNAAGAEIAQSLEAEAEPKG